MAYENYPAHKLTYLRNVTGSQERVRYLFDTFLPYEKKMYKDLCLFTTEELQAVLDREFCSVRHTATHAASIIRSYNRWCRHKGHMTVSDEMGIGGVKIDRKDKIRAGQYSSPYHLQLELETVFLPEAEPSRNALYRSFFWLAYAGLQDADALALKREDVDLRNMTVRYRERECPLYREGIGDLAAARDETAFAVRHGRSGKTMWIDRQASDLLFRGTREEGMGLKSFRSNISNRVGSTGSALSYHQVMLSGVYYRMYLRERAGFPPDTEEGVLVMWSPDSDKQKEDSSLIQRKKKRIGREIAAGYDRWKEAFRTN